jgi:hypothetical protein
MCASAFTRLKSLQLTDGDAAIATILAQVAFLISEEHATPSPSLLAELYSLDQTESAIHDCLVKQFALLKAKDAFRLVACESPAIQNSLRTWIASNFTMLLPEEVCLVMRLKGSEFRERSLQYVVDNVEQMDTQETLQIVALTGLTPHLRELLTSKVTSMTLQQLALFLLHDELSPDDIRA